MSYDFCEQVYTETTGTWERKDSSTIFIERPWLDVCPPFPFEKTLGQQTRLQNELVAAQIHIDEALRGDVNIQTLITVEVYSTQGINIRPGWSGSKQRYHRNQSRLCRKARVREFVPEYDGHECFHSRIMRLQSRPKRLLPLQQDCAPVEQVVLPEDEPDPP